MSHHIRVELVHNYVLVHTRVADMFRCKNFGSRELGGQVEGRQPGV